MESNVVSTFFLCRWCVSTQRHWSRQRGNGWNRARSGVF